MVGSFNPTMEIEGGVILSLGEISPLLNRGHC